MALGSERQRRTKVVAQAPPLPFCVGFFGELYAEKLAHSPLRMHSCRYKDRRREVGAKVRRWVRVQHEYVKILFAIDRTPYRGRKYKGGTRAISRDPGREYPRAQPENTRGRWAPVVPKDAVTGSGMFRGRYRNGLDVCGDGSGVDEKYMGLSTGLTEFRIKVATLGKSKLKTYDTE